MKVQYSTRVVGVLAALLFTSATPPVSAHHSRAPFDMSKQISLRGTVEKWLWANPHSWLYIRLSKADGSQEIWGFEAGSTGMLIRGGWNAHDFKPGDKVNVSAYPSRDGTRVALLAQVQLPNGRVLKSGFGGPPGGTPSAPPR